MDNQNQGGMPQGDAGQQTPPPAAPTPEPMGGTTEPTTPAPMGGEEHPSEPTPPVGGDMGGGTPPTQPGM